MATIITEQPAWVLEINCKNGHELKAKIPDNAIVGQKFKMNCNKCGEEIEGEIPERPSIIVSLKL